jgi:hypothetical protein
MIIKAAEISWIFSDTVAGAKASAMVYSLMLTCRVCNVEPYAYILHGLTELTRRPPDADISDLLPFNFEHTSLSRRDRPVKMSPCFVSRDNRKLIS